MKRAWIVIFLVLIPMMFATAQMAPSPATAPGAATTNPLDVVTKGLSLPGGIFDKFWDDPAMADELKLTVEQKRQLRDASTKMQIAFIDQCADAVKALVMLDAISSADELDDAAYHKQLDYLSAATSKLVHQFGEVAIAPRRILTPVQYAKLKSLQKARREAAQAAARQAAPTVGTSPRHAAIPQSLQESSR